MATSLPSQPTDDDPMANEPVELIEAFYHPAFGVVLWHDYPEADGSFVMSARMNDPSRAQHFVDSYAKGRMGDKPRFSAN